MIKPDFTIKYKIENNEKIINVSESFKNSEIEIIFQISENQIKIEAFPLKEIVLKEFRGKAQMQFPYKKAFVNGYQSWTDSKEFMSDEKMKRLTFLSKITNSIFKFSQYGDYNFFKDKLKEGEFYGFGIAYLHENEDYEFYISENEDNFHTIIKFSMNTQNIEFIVDCDEVVVDKPITLLNIKIEKGNYTILQRYFKSIGIQHNTKSKIGWTSWYNYYQNINEKIILKNLHFFSEYFPEESVFQIDDGFQTFVGDWLDIDKTKFPNGLSEIVKKIHEKNYKAGLWLAPFSAQKNSKLVKNHPDWILKDKRGKKIFGGINWGGFYALDFYNQEFRTYLKDVFNEVLNIWNFDLLKLDFLYSVAIISQQGKSRAKVMTESLNFLRELVGEKKILGCGVPIMQAFNRVDYCRIGADISLDWNGKFYEKYLHRERVSTYNTLKNTIYRRFFDNSVFLNDPDVFLLRNENIKMTKEQKVTVYLINAIFGSLVFTSDDFSKYSEWQKQLLKNLKYFHKAQVSDVKEDRDLIKYDFIIENKKYTGLSNLSEKNRKINSSISEILDIFKLEKITFNSQKIIKPFETIIYER